MTQITQMGKGGAVPLRFMCLRDFRVLRVFRGNIATENAENAENAEGEGAEAAEKGWRCALCLRFTRGAA